MKKILIILSILVVVVILTLTLSFKVFSVSGMSMEPTLKDGEQILVFKFAYNFSKTERGDLILVKAEDKTWVKRIVGLPREQIEIKDGKIKINDKVLLESYIKEIHTYGDQRVILGENQFYVLGDNREPNQSIDSRIFGPISKKSILGKVIARISPNFKFLKKQAYQLTD